MVLDPKAKDFLLKNLKIAINGLQERNFAGLKKLVIRMNAISEIFPDEIWTKELSLACISMAVIGASTEVELTKMKKEKIDELVKAYSEKLNELYSAIEEENIAKIDTFLKEFAEIFFREIGL